MFIEAFLMSSLAYTQIIFNYYYDENSNKCEQSVWYCLTFLGEVVSIIYAIAHLYPRVEVGNCQINLEAVYHIGCGSYVYPVGVYPFR